MIKTKVDIGQQILDSIWQNVQVQMLSDQDIMQIRFALFNALKREIDSLR